MSTIEEIRAEIAKQEQEHRAVIDLEQAEAREKANRERKKKESAEALERLRFQEAEAVFDEAKEHNKELIRENERAIKQMQGTLGGVVDKLSEQLRGVASGVYTSHQKQQEHAQRAVGAYWKAKHHAEYIERSTAFDATSQGAKRAVLDNATNVYGAIQAMVKAEKDPERRRIWQALAFIITGVEP